MNIQCAFMDTPLGNRVKVRLKTIGKNQKWLANQVKLSPSQITQLIKGDRGTSVDKLVDIGVVLGIERDEIIKLYRNEKSDSKSNIRKAIETDLDRIERLDEDRLNQVANFVELIANSIQGNENATTKKRTGKAQN